VSPGRRPVGCGGSEGEGVGRASAHGPNDAIGLHGAPRAGSIAAIRRTRGRATFTTTALENGAQLEDVLKAAGNRDPSTTKLYDRRGYDPERATSFFARY
jgi:hypothetical protein